MEHIIQVPAQFIEDSDWIRFPGGVLAGKCPKTTCPTCRAAVGRASEPRAGATLCFQCYRAEIDRDRALKAAGQLDTASTRRFQTALPFEPVNRPRLEMLKVERATARASALRQVCRAPSAGADRRAPCVAADRRGSGRPQRPRGGALWKARARARDGGRHSRRGAPAPGIVASVRRVEMSACGHAGAPGAATAPVKK